MKKIVSWLVAIGVIGFIAAYAGSSLLVKSRKAPAPSNVAEIKYDAALIEKGEYLARLSDWRHVIPLPETLNMPVVLRCRHLLGLSTQQTLPLT